MSRIGRAFARRFRELLAALGAREREKGVRWLFERGAWFAEQEHLSHSAGLTRANIELAGKVHRLHRRLGHPPPSPPRIICDAGLGGLARWLRAAGCETFWTQDIDDAELVREARRLGALLLTTDSFLLDRRAITQGEVSALWVPPTITKHEQLALVRAELDLPETESRCMKCGGELIAVDKEAVRDEIPPKTYRWVDEYFRCAQCGQLYWHGTHWQKVTRKLDGLRREPVTSP